VTINGNYSLYSGEPYGEKKFGGQGRGAVNGKKKQKEHPLWSRKELRLPLFEERGGKRPQENGKGGRKER